MKGISAFSYHFSVTCSGEKETRAAPVSSATCKALAAAPGWCSASASVKSSQGFAAFLAPRATAWFLPTQPAGTPCVSRRRSFGMLAMSPRTISAVLSVDWSLTTRISAISGWRASDSIQAAMDGSSLRAGTMALMAAGRMEAALDGSLGMFWSRVRACFRSGADGLV